MMTKNSSSSRIFAVWMVLLAFLCGMIVPSLAVANQDMTIGSEGDPGDGLESSGGGSGQEIVIPPNSNSFQPSVISFFDDPQVSGIFGFGYCSKVLVGIPVFEGNTLYFIMVISNSGQFERGRN